MRRRARSRTADFSAVVLMGRRMDDASRSAIRRSLLAGVVGVDSVYLDVTRCQQVNEFRIMIIIIPFLYSANSRMAEL